MTRCLSLLLAPALLGVAAAAPVPKEAVGKAVPITAANADKVEALSTVPRTTYRITRGPDRGTVLLSGYNQPVELVDDVKFRAVRTLVKGRILTDLVFSPDGRRIAYNERGRSTYVVQGARDDDAGKPVTLEIGEHPGRAAFSPDGKTLAVGYTYWAPNAHGAGHSETRLFDLTGKLFRTVGKTGPGAVQPVFSPDGKTLAVGNRNYQTLLIDAATGALLHTLDRRMTQDIAFSPDGKTLAAGYVDGAVALWDVATGKKLHSAPSTCKEVYSVDWGLKGDVLVTSGRDGKIVLWAPKNLEKIKELDAPFWVIAARFTRDGSRILTSSATDHTARTDRKITVWGVPDRAKK